MALSPSRLHPHSGLDWLESWGTGGRPRVSVVVPAFNEEENLPVLYYRVDRALSTIGSFEVVFVDDGSSDGSVSIIAELQGRDPRVRLVRFSRNFGHQAALSAGIDHASGDAVILNRAGCRRGSASSRDCGAGPASNRSEFRTIALPVTPARSSTSCAKWSTSPATG